MWHKTLEAAEIKRIYYLSFSAESIGLARTYRSKTKDKIDNRPKWQIQGVFETWLFFFTLWFLKGARWLYHYSWDRRCGAVSWLFTPGVNTMKHNRSLSFQYNFYGSSRKWSDIDFDLYIFCFLYGRGWPIFAEIFWKPIHPHEIICYGSFHFYISCTLLMLLRNFNVANCIFSRILVKWIWGYDFKVVSFTMLYYCFLCYMSFIMYEYICSLMQ